MKPKTMADIFKRVIGGETYKSVGEHYNITASATMCRFNRILRRIRYHEAKKGSLNDKDFVWFDQNLKEIRSHRDYWERLYDDIFGE